MNHPHDPRWPLPPPRRLWWPWALLIGGAAVITWAMVMR